jgi:hypothetical protein
MDTTAYSEGKYVTKDLVKNSPTKIATILTEAIVVKGTFGDQLSCEVELDKRTKTWNLTIEQVKTCKNAFGTDSLLWIGKQVQFLVIPVGSKEKLVCVAKL